MRRPIAVVVLALFVAACAPAFDGPPDPTTTTQPIPIDQAAADLATARAAWESVGSADYTYEFRNDCGECDPAERSPRRIAVLEGQALTVGENEQLLTVEEIFGNIERAINAGREVKVVYDQTTGHPTDVQIDMDQRPVDGGTHWILEDWTDLEPIGSAAELQAARRLWESQQLDDYQFLMKVECDCPEKGAFDVKVVNDQIFEVMRLDQPGEVSDVTPVTMSQTFDDLEEWFTETQNLIDQGILEVDIRVDPVMGYPRWVYLKAQYPNDDPADLFTAVITMDLVAAFDPGPPSTVPDFGDLTSLLEAQDLWTSTGPSDYRYTLTIHCLCPEEYTGPFELVVRDQQVVSATWNGNPLEPGQGARYTIEEVFALITRAIEDGTDVEVAYDPVFGHPQMVTIDVEAVAVDGGLAFSIHNLAVLEGPGGVAGLVVAGPTCPVQQDPPDPACADRPVSGAVLVVFNANNAEIGRVTTDPDGSFEIPLKPGSYRIDPQPVEGLLGTAPPFELNVVTGITDRVTVQYDTGIR